MAQYQVTNNQNIFDIALHLYGSIEGIYDLLISNPWLNMGTVLTKGMTLEYHDYFVINSDIVSEINKLGYAPANSKRKVHYKKIDQPCVMQMIIPVTEIKMNLKWSGDGVAVVDWGDNSDLESIQLSSTINTYTHYFDNTVDKRIVKIYGDFALRSWDTSDLESQLYVLRPITVDEYYSQKGKTNFDGLKLFDGTYMLDLSNRAISDLSPIYDMHLQTLDLRNVIFKERKVLDDYLVNLVNNHSNRRNCTVYLSSQPSEVGMNAIQTIINEPAWNVTGKWVFNINGNIYTAK